MGGSILQRVPGAGIGQKQSGRKVWVTLDAAFESLRDLNTLTLKSLSVQWGWYCCHACYHSGFLGREDEVGAGKKQSSLPKERMLILLAPSFLFGSKMSAWNDAVK